MTRPRGLNTYRIEGEVAYLALRNRQGEIIEEALVDAADIPLLLAEGGHWCRWRAGSATYVARYRPTGKVIYLHRLLCPAGHGLVDHINGNGLDNRRSNLRTATPSENQWNRGAQTRNPLGLKGVHYDRQNGNYRATLKCHGKKYDFGRFATPEEAARAYDAGALKLHGEFARLNFPDDAQPALLRRPA